jgi:hypothetical protein
MSFIHAPMRSIKFLFVLTLIQFWWIAIWGIAYITIDAIAGQSKITELWIYVIMLIFTAIVIQLNPDMIERL